MGAMKKLATARQLGQSVPRVPERYDWRAEMAARQNAARKAAETVRARRELARREGVPWVEARIAREELGEDAAEYLARQDAALDAVRAEIARTEARPTHRQLSLFGD